MSSCIPKPSSEMKDDLGRWRTTSLFWETRRANEDKYPPLWSLKDRAHTVGKIVYPSFKELYLSYDHVPLHEYQFVLDTLGSWKHWQVLCDSTIGNHISEWREELTVRIKADALRRLMAVSRESTSVGVAAARYLADEGYLPKKVGRVSKEEKLRAVKQAAGVRDSLEEDMARLNLNVITGGK